VSAKAAEAGSAQRELDGFIDKYLPEIAAQARACLKILRPRLPGAMQLVYDNYNFLVIGFGPSERASDAIFSLAVAPRHMNVFFLQGKRVPDPHKLLRGDGNVVRSIRLASPEDLNQPEVCELMAAAMESARVPIDPDAPGKLIIRSVSAKQHPRRPSVK
jgi:hypothetical protein